MKRLKQSQTSQDCLRKREIKTVSVLTKHSISLDCGDGPVDYGYGCTQNKEMKNPWGIEE